MDNLEQIFENASIYPINEDFIKQANLNEVTYNQLMNLANSDYLKFWETLALKYLDWHTPFTEVLDQSDAPFYRWFLNGKLNVSYNCLDRNLPKFANKIAIICENDDFSVNKITYQELYIRVCKFANALKSLSVQAQERVIIYMPNTIDAIIAMQACARIGAIHSVVFVGFSAKALAERIEDTGAKIIITVDSYMRGGKLYFAKNNVDEAIGLLNNNTIKHVIINNINNNCENFNPTIDHWWHTLEDSCNSTCEPYWTNSYDTLFILYTSGSTGKPKGIEHATAGYLLGAIITLLWVFDYKESDIFCCTADIGWITGHTYICYAPLALGATQVIYNGTPLFPDSSRYYQLIQNYKISIFYTAPTAIRALIKVDSLLPNSYNLNSLRLLGSVGESINKEAWIWYYTIIGQKRCPIVDTWWQTETGCNMLAPIPGINKLKPGSCINPIPGIFVDLEKIYNESSLLSRQGALIITKPFPSQLKGVWQNKERYIKTYFEYIQQNDNLKIYYYKTGDEAYVDKQGYYWILGRLDDVIHVSGHRIGTMEIESALIASQLIVEAAVVGKKDSIRGESIYAFVVLKNEIINKYDTNEIVKKLQEVVIQEIGRIARPDDIKLVHAIPKTRSGKIMRRLLRSIANNEAISQDISTLENASVIAEIQNLK